MEERTEKLIGLVALVGFANKIVEAKKLRWRSKHYTIFNVVSKLISSRGEEVSWVDPDASFEDDVRTYMKALNEKREEWVEELRVLTE